MKTNTNIKIKKNELRKTVKQRLKQLSQNKKYTKSQQIFSQIESLPLFISANTILCYWTIQDEVITYDFIEKWYKNKTILLPVIQNDMLILKQYTGKENMQPDPTYNIPEPCGKEFTNYKAIDMMIIPGLAFDKQNNRMGRGKGFYDKLLNNSQTAYSIGIAYSEQIFDNIPIEKHDKTLNRIIFA